MLAGNVRHFTNGKGGHDDLAVPREGEGLKAKVEAGADGKSDMKELAGSEGASNGGNAFSCGSGKYTPEKSDGEVAPTDVQLFARIEEQSAACHRRQFARHSILGTANTPSRMGMAPEVIAVGLRPQKWIGKLKEWLPVLKRNVHCCLQHPHELAGGQPVTGNIRNLGHPPSIGFHQVDYITAQFCTRD